MCVCVCLCVFLRVLLLLLLLLLLLFFSLFEMFFCCFWCLVFVWSFVFLFLQRFLLFGFGWFCSLFFEVFPFCFAEEGNNLQFFVGRRGECFVGYVFGFLLVFGVFFL